MLVTENKTLRFAGFEFDALKFNVLLSILATLYLVLQFHSADVLYALFAVPVGLAWRYILPLWRMACGDAQRKVAPELDKKASDAASLFFSASTIQDIAALLSRAAFIVCSIVVYVQELLFSCVGFLAHVCLTPRLAHTPLRAC